MLVRDLSSTILFVEAESGLNPRPSDPLLYTPVSVTLQQWFQSLVLRPAATALPGNLQKSRVLGPTSDPLNQKFWEWGPARCVFPSPPGDSTGAQAWEPQCYGFKPEEKQEEVEPGVTGDPRCSRMVQASAVAAMPAQIPLP